MDRIEKAIKFIDLKGNGLEIGPSYNPIVPKASGARIKTIDCLDREKLIQKYSGEKHITKEMLDKIEDVDYIWSGETLVDLIGEENVFDYIIASHFIEHTTDLLGFIQDCEGLLRPNGVLSLIIPDKRYCFDRFKPLTTVGSVLDTHFSNAKFHSPGAIIDNIVYNVTRGDRVLGWNSKSTEKLNLSFPDIRWARELLEEVQRHEKYHDVHRWIFTPKSFTLLLQDLHDLGYHNLFKIGSFETSEYEFFVSLSKSCKNYVHFDRFELLLQIEKELRSINNNESHWYSIKNRFFGLR
jgi:predicted SAM-dependent methyltransferase